MAAAFLALTASGLLVHTYRRKKTVSPPRAEESTPNAVQPGRRESVAQSPRIELYGDPLPPSALARLGTLRFRYPSDQWRSMAFTPDGKALLVVKQGRPADLLDAVSGKLIRRFGDLSYYQQKLEQLRFS